MSGWASRQSYYGVRVWAVLVCFSSPSFGGFFSRPMFAFEARVNGVRGHLSVERFKCPLSVHVASSALMFCGEPLSMNLLGHGVMKLLELLRWARFSPNEKDDYARSVRRTVEVAEMNQEIVWTVARSIKRGRDLVLETHPEAKKAEFLGGEIDLELKHERIETLWERPDYPDRIQLAGPRRGKIMVDRPVVKVKRAHIVFESNDEYIPKYFRFERREDDSHSVQEVPWGCSSLVAYGR